MSIKRRAEQVSLWIVVSLLILAYPVVLMILNAAGPSTGSYNPIIGTAEPNPNNPKRPIVYLGDNFYVNVTVVRHKPPWLQAPGSCEFAIKRYAEVVSGPREGTRYLISVGHLEFRGQDQLIPSTRWPQPNEKSITLGYAVDEDGNTLKDQPLLPDGVDEEEFAFYVVGRYYCNIMDDFIPRYTNAPRAYAIVKRHKP